MSLRKLSKAVLTVPNGWPLLMALKSCTRVYVWTQFEKLSSRMGHTSKSSIRWSKAQDMVCPLLGQEEGASGPPHHSRHCTSCNILSSKVLMGIWDWFAARFAAHYDLPSVDTRSVNGSIECHLYETVGRVKISWYCPTALSLLGERHFYYDADRKRMLGMVELRIQGTVCVVGKGNHNIK